MQNIRRRVVARLAGEESGFTLIELLVVMLILGILAAIALPAFFNQKDKAGDAKAKEYAHTAQVAMETYSTENEGDYTGAEPSTLEGIEPSLKSAEIEVSNASTTGYEVTSKSSTGNTFTIKNEAGEVTFPCTIEEEGNAGGCKRTGTGNTGTWGGEDAE